MKTKTLLALATIAVATSAASAATIIFSFGSTDPTPTETINRVAQTDANGSKTNVTLATVRDTTNAVTGMSTSATGADQWFSAGSGGSFSPVGTTNYDDTNALVNGWKAAYLPTNVRWTHQSRADRRFP